MKIIVLGSPGVGKGTYTQDLVKKLDVVHISTGELFRENIKNETELGKQANEYISKGNLVPDEVTIAMVKDRLANLDNGFILDGFPRTVPQAEALAGFSAMDLVILFKADHEVIIQRLSGRITCKDCSRIFHKTNLPPKEEGVCDICQGTLYQRDDDKPETVKERLITYEQKTAPLIDFYREKGLLREITINEDYGTHGVEIMGRIMEIVNSVHNP